MDIAQPNSLVLSPTVRKTVIIVTALMVAIVAYAVYRGSKSVSVT